MAFLASIEEFDKLALKEQVTRITTKTGKIFEEKCVDGNWQNDFLGQGPIPSYLESSGPGFSQISCRKFVESLGRWESVQSPNPTTQVEREIKLITYNVWFSTNNWVNRALSLFDIINREDANLICLQEVTTDFLKLLLKQEWVRNCYFVSDANGSTVIPYGVVILSKHYMSNVTLFDMPTDMGRRLLLCGISLNGDNFIVGTVHLESMNNSEMRINQLARIQEITSAHENWMLLGDFNFHAQMRENQHIADIDAWELVHGQGSSAREVTRRGLMIDRVIIKGGNWVPLAIRRIGCDPIVPLEGNEVTVPSHSSAGTEKMMARDEEYPSDHDGVVVQFGARGQSLR